MVLLMRYTNVESRDKFERQALKITGVAFYLLTAGLVVGATLNISQKKAPETTLVGIIISSISILTMWWLMSEKKRTGNKLKLLQYLVVFLFIPKSSPASCSISQFSFYIYFFEMNLNKTTN